MLLDNPVFALVGYRTNSDEASECEELFGQPFLESHMIEAKRTDYEHTDVNSTGTAATMT